MAAGIFGRDEEVCVLSAFVEAVPRGPRALVMTGEAGAGKTTLLDVAIQRARSVGHVVLQARPAQREVTLSFAGLADLFEGQLTRVLAELPDPLRRALGVALLAEEAVGPAPEPRAISAAVRASLRTLADRVPVLLIVDDVQWLDPPSADALAFALRRLDGDDRVGLLCAQRSASDGALPLGLSRASLHVERVHLDGLSIGALHRVLGSRLALSVSRPTLHRIVSVSGGNPLVALELARAMQRRGDTRLGHGAAVSPTTVGELLAERLALLPPGATDVLQVAALLGELTVSGLLAVMDDPIGLDAAVSAGVLTVQGARLSFAHPLLAAAVVAGIPPARRREVHRMLAAHADDLEQRARHLAAATSGRAEAVAAELEKAALQAAARGAPASAGELFELAAEFTPAGTRDRRWRRTAEAADYLARAGETRIARALLENLVSSMPPGPVRADALARLAWLREDDFAEARRLVDQAVEEAGEDLARVADIHLSRSDILAILADLGGAREAAGKALAAAEDVGDDALLASALAQVVVCDLIGGYPVDAALLERGLMLERTVSALRLRTPPSQAAGMWHLASGRFARARETFETALAKAEADGVEYWRSDILLRLSLTEGRAGNLGRSLQLADAGLEVAEQLGLDQLTSALLHGRGLAMLALGRVEAARSDAVRGQELSRLVGDEVYSTLNDALVGIIDLTVGECAAAASRLVPLWDRVQLLGARPTTVRVLVAAVESLVAAGRIGEAQTRVVLLERDAHSPADRALVARCSAMVAAGHGSLEAAHLLLQRAMRLHGEQPEPLELVQTQLALGNVLRRLKQRSAARDVLTDALQTCERIGAGGWAERARGEIARVSGRAPGATGLTDAERRVAGLVARGMTNKAIAAQLFLSVRAVETTLSHTYRKLGVRSRTELAAALHDGRWKQ